MPRDFSAPRTASHWPKWPPTRSAPLPSASAACSASQPGPAGALQDARSWNVRAEKDSTKLRPKLSAHCRRTSRRSAAVMSGKISRRLPSMRRRRSGSKVTAPRSTAEPSARRDRHGSARATAEERALRQPGEEVACRIALAGHRQTGAAARKRAPHRDRDRGVVMPRSLRCRDPAASPQAELARGVCGGSRRAVRVSA